MDEAVAVGIVSLLIGLVVCLRGYVALRIIISLLGAWVGFFLGAAIVASVTGEGFLAAGLTWVGAIVGALLLGILAYAFYQVAVLIGMGSLGFSIAAGVMAVLGVDSAFLVWIVGGAAAVLMVLLAMITDLPAGLLIVLTSFAGANITVTGLLILLGTVTVDDLESGRAPDGLASWWSLVALGLAVVGIVVQSRGVARVRMREAWSGRSGPGR